MFLPVAGFLRTRPGFLPPIMPPQISDTEGMATSAPHLSVEEFHRLYDGVKPYREYWFGEAVPKSIPTSLHSAIQFALMMLFRARGWKALSEVRIRIVRDAEPLPDVLASRVFETSQPAVVEQLMDKRKR